MKDRPLQDFYENNERVNVGKSYQEYLVQDELRKQKEDMEYFNQFKRNQNETHRPI